MAALSPVGKRPAGSRALAHLNGAIGLLPKRLHQDAPAHHHQCFWSSSRGGARRLNCQRDKGHQVCTATPIVARKPLHIQPLRMALAFGGL